ncbi:hypothetical protein [Corynebacterium dentalis]|uniref:hypothetical protein n=1 Tax=Corynebacterium dentalis TaxID=2014528 RepID=UPI0028973B74|nr:hypothetical protein [Corynebacterium dentalis]
MNDLNSISYQPILEIFAPVFYGDREMTAHLLDAWDESMMLLEERNRQQEERDQIQGSQ